MTPDNETDPFENLNDPSDPKRAVRVGVRPREAPEPVIRELGDPSGEGGTDAEEPSEFPEREDGVIMNLSARPGGRLVKFKRSEVEDERPRRSRDQPPKPSRREERKAKKAERKAKKAEEKARAKAETGEATGVVRGPLPPQEGTQGVLAAKGEEEGVFGLDDLDMENPLPEGAYSPERDHADLVMDRKRRRLEAAARLEQREKEQLASWELERDPETEAAERKRFSLPVYMFQAIFVLLAGILIVMGVRTALQSAQDAEMSEAPSAVHAPTMEDLGLVEAEQVLHDYLKADGWEAKLAFVRNPEVARPRMERFYGDFTGEDRAVEDFEVIGSQYKDEPVPGGVGFLFYCDIKGGNRLEIPVVKIESEAPFFVVDWESTVDYADVRWDAFLAKREPGSRGIFRLYVAEDDYYHYDFIDQKRLASLKLYDREASRVAYGYVGKATDIWSEIRKVLGIWHGRMTREDLRRPEYSVEDKPEDRLSEREKVIRSVLEEERRRGRRNLVLNSSLHWVEREEKVAPMTLEVEFPEEVSDSALPQLRISRFVSTNWVVVESERGEPVDPGGSLP